MEKKGWERESTFFLQKEAGKRKQKAEERFFYSFVFFTSKSLLFTFYLFV